MAAEWSFAQFRSISIKKTLTDRLCVMIKVLVCTMDRKRIIYIFEPSEFSRVEKKKREMRFYNFVFTRDKRTKHYKRNNILTVSHTRSTSSAYYWL